MTEKDVFDDLEMLKLWKALYYCFWSSDQVPVQLELSRRLTKLIHVFPKKSNAKLFLRMALRTLLREWPSLDQYRVNKFYDLITMLVSEALVLCVSSGQKKEKEIKGVLEILETEVLTKVPNGVRFHVCQYFLQSIMTTTQGDIDTEMFLFFLGPFFRLLATTEDRYLSL